MRLRLAAIVLGLPAALALACATPAPQPAPGTSGVMGRVQLVPREGVAAGGSGGGYGDRRMRDVRLVDYERPGFSVVYVEAPGAFASRPGAEAGDAPPVALEIRQRATGARIEPRHAAVRVGAPIEITNRSARTQIVSLPGDATVRKIEPDTTARIALASAGPHRVFLLEDASEATTVFAAPGPFSTTSSNGDFALTDLEPGATRLQVWHPRFPPASADVVLEPDTTLSVDIEIGVGRASTDPAPASIAPRSEGVPK